MGYYGGTSVYRGDYYRGDYYRGDPFLGALIGRVASSIGLGKLAAKAGRWAVQRITGSGLKRAAGVAAGAAAAAAGTAIVNRVVNPPTEMTPIEMDAPVLTAGGGGGGGGGTQWVQTASGRRMRVRWSASKGKWVAVRSMNPLNPRALRRAVSRAERFTKFSRSVLTATRRPDGSKKFKSKGRGR